MTNEVVKIKIDMDLPKDLFNKIWIVEYKEDRITRTEKIPSKSVVIDGVTYNSIPTIKKFVRKKKLAYFEEWDYDGFTLDVVPEYGVELTISYSCYRGCGEYDNHWEDARKIYEKIGVSIFFDKSVAQKICDDFNSKQVLSEEYEEK